MSRCFEAVAIIFIIFKFFFIEQCNNISTICLYFRSYASRLPTVITLLELPSLWSRCRSIEISSSQFALTLRPIRISRTPCRSKKRKLSSVFCTTSMVRMPIIRLLRPTFDSTILIDGLFIVPFDVEVYFSNILHRENLRG